MRFSGFLAGSVILLVVWAAAFFVYHVANPAIHVVLLFAVVMLALHFLWDGKKNDLSRPS
jgi:hypothetical protein